MRLRGGGVNEESLWVHIDTDMVYQGSVKLYRVAYQSDLHIALAEALAMRKSVDSAGRSGRASMEVSASDLFGHLMSKLTVEDDRTFVFVDAIQGKEIGDRHVRVVDHGEVDVVRLLCSHATGQWQEGRDTSQASGS